MSIKRIPPRQLELGSLQYFEPLAEDPVGNQLALREGWVKNQETLVYKAAQFSVAFTPVTAGNVRWDLVYLDPDGSVQTAAGTQVVSGSPEFTGAADPPAYAFPIAYVKIDETGAVLVEDADITDLRPKSNICEDATYSNNYGITNGEYYGESIGKIDAVTQYSDAYAGKPDKTSVLPVYTDFSAPEYAIADDQPLVEGVANLDIEADRVKTFVGKASLSETLPDYSGETTHHYIDPNDPLCPAVGKLDQALYDSLVSFTVAGSVLWFAADTPPAGTLVCNGALLLVADYPALFSVIGYTFGGSGLDFNLPDLRGEFIRGWDAGKGTDPGRLFGSYQADEFESHTHRAKATGTPGAGSMLVTNVGPAWTSSLIEATGGTETRPRNIALLPCIKY
jgi:microcystin-dependent protein